VEVEVALSKRYEAHWHTVLHTLQWLHSFNDYLVSIVCVCVREWRITYIGGRIAPDCVSIQRPEHVPESS